MEDLGGIVGFFAFIVIAGGIWELFVYSHLAGTSVIAWYVLIIAAAKQWNSK